MGWKWPVYTNHDDVKCWDCGKSLADAKSTASVLPEFAVGNGQYNKSCVCGSITYYDIRKKVS